MAADMWVPSHPERNGAIPQRRLPQAAEMPFPQTGRASDAPVVLIRLIESLFLNGFKSE